MRNLFLLILFTVGFSLPSTLLTSCCKDCEDPGPAFFDVTGIQSATHQVRLTTSQATTTVGSDELIEYSKYAYTQVIFTADYVASPSIFKAPWNFSLIPNALACDCKDFAGYDGAKTESLTTLTVTALDDFNDTIKAGDDATALFNIDPIPGSTELLPSLYLELYMNTKPNHTNPIRFQVDLSLSSGEQYTSTTVPVGFI